MQRRRAHARLAQSGSPPLVTTYAPDPSPVRHPLCGCAVAGLQPLHAGVRPDRGRSVQGYVAAFRDPRVLSAIQSGAMQAIAVTMVQWTGPALQIQVLPWTLINDATTTQAFAATIAATPRRLFSGGTSISGVIDYAVPLMLESPFKGTRRVIDISGDGSNNRGRPAAIARDAAMRAGIIINGLPILALEPGLDHYFADHVIGGPGAFVIAAESYETFADAILKKLIREMAANEPRPYSRWYAARPQPGKR
jgi:hypothetical protein